MRLLDDRRHRRLVDRPRVVVGHDLDHVGADPQVFEDGAAALVRIARGQIFLIDQRLRHTCRRRERLTAVGRDLPAGRDDARTGDPARTNSVTQRHVAVDPRVTDVAHGREPCVEQFAGHRGAEERARFVGESRDSVSRRLSDGLLSGSIAASRCAWQSIRPGSTVYWLRTTTVTSLGAAALTASNAPTCRILPPSIQIP